MANKEQYTKEEVLEMKEHRQANEDEMNAMSQEEAHAMIYSDKQTWKRTPFLEEKFLWYIGKDHSIASAAKLCNISRQTVYNWMEEDPLFEKRVRLHRGVDIMNKAIEVIESKMYSEDEKTALKAAMYVAEKTKYFDHKHDPEFKRLVKEGGNTLLQNPSTGVFEIEAPVNVHPDDRDPDGDPLEAKLYQDDPEIN